MIQCARCSAANQPTSKYCLSCGAPMPAAGPAGFGAASPPAPASPPAAQPPPAAPGQGFGPPPAWAAPGYGPAPAPPPAPGFGGPPPGPPAGFGPAPAPAQSPSPEAERFRIGSPDGLNPFGATMTPGGSHPGFGPPPAQGYGAPPASPPHAGQGFGPPPAAPPPQAFGGGAPQQPAPFGPGGFGGVPPAAPPPISPAQHGAPAIRHSHDPSAFAPTAPPTREEYGAPAAPAQPAMARGGYAPQGSQSGAGMAQPTGARISQPGGATATGRDPEFLEPGALRTLAGFLVSYEQTDIGMFWPLYQGQNLVGRKGAAPGLDIEIDHPTTSSRHAVLYASARPARLKLEDSGSTNGTYVGEQALERGRKHEIRDGEVVRFGGFSAIVKLI